MRLIFWKFQSREPSAVSPSRGDGAVVSSNSDEGASSVDVMWPAGDSTMDPGSVDTGCCCP
jgi:hypothetical protein